MSTPSEERPPARRRAAPQLPDPMSPVMPAIAKAAEPAPPAPDVPPARGSGYDPAQWSGYTAAMGGRVAVEAKELLAPLAKAYGLKTERAVIEKLIIDAARTKLPDGPSA